MLGFPRGGPPVLQKITPNLRAQTFAFLQQSGGRAPGSLTSPPVDPPSEDRAVSACRQGVKFQGVETLDVIEDDQCCGSHTESTSARTVVSLLPRVTDLARTFPLGPVHTECTRVPVEQCSAPQNRTQILVSRCAERFPLRSAWAGFNEKGKCVPCHAAEAGV